MKRNELLSDSRQTCFEWRDQLILWIAGDANRVKDPFELIH